MVDVIDYKAMAADWQRRLDSRPVQPQPMTKKILTEIMRQRMAQTNPETGLTYGQMIIDAAIHKAIETGDCSEIMDRLEGRVPQAFSGEMNVNSTSDSTPALERLSGTLEWLKGHIERARAPREVAASEPDRPLLPAPVHAEKVRH